MWSNRMMVLDLKLSKIALPDHECYTANGKDYRGQQNQTFLQGGKPCLYWNETLQHPYNTIEYPNGEGGLGKHNYCRNPDGDVRPWCYIADHEDGIYWKYCDIPTCRKEDAGVKQSQDNTGHHTCAPSQLAVDRETGAVDVPGSLGCFKDSGEPPTLTGTSETSNKITIQNCISFCRKQKYKLAGMESGYACFCGNDLDYHQHGEAAGSECNHECFGDHTQPCGGDGRVIVFDTRVGACGGNYTSPSAVVYSPDFPDNYNANHVCYWTIQVPGASAILFNFTFFEIIDQTDMVELLDGHTNHVVVRFDGRNPPRSAINITADFVILYFYSDRTNQAQGFAVLYQALMAPEPRPNEEDKDVEETASLPASTAEPSLESVTGKTNDSTAGQSSQILYVITSSPTMPDHNMPVWTIYALAALLTLTVIAMIAKLLLHITVKSPTIPSISSSEACNQNTGSEPWIIFYRPSTISFFKKKLKNHHGDLSPLVGN
ncbi:kremen protein 1 isoform X2 [Brienomyrus brachyistius]|uniref:kremen protein 1 isoform X2 n=1 Tax=Brienomyrus brachyistius TaxID=42636 RepID=UPI0020B19EC1|nr:kremen protein 1 isoform X2 [Brienomyrus brachyistius]